MTYQIRENYEYNSREVYFDAKPAEAVREALKALKMRWNGKKACWYGYATESALVAAILGQTAEEEQTQTAIVTDGYMGGGAIYGGKSGRHLYGAELSGAIRADLKAAGIKGATVSCSTYSGGQSITVTVKAAPGDFVPFGEFVAAYQPQGSFGRFCYYTEAGKVDTATEAEFYAMEADRREAVRQSAARYDYDRQTRDKCSICSGYHLDTYKAFTPAFVAKLEQIRDIVAAYNYDNSNAQVDYFDTNFYWTLTVKPAQN